MNKTILVTGGTGMVGQCVPFGIRPGHPELDVTDPESIEMAVKKYTPSVILHLAAYTNMQDCQSHPELARAVNVEGTKNIARACKHHHIYLVYLSTCGVFNGKKKTPYVETDIPHPLTVYGQTKYEGELAVRNIQKDSLIIRTGWLFGGRLETDIKFVGITIRKFLRNKPVVATVDRFGSPTYINDLFSAIKKLIDRRRTGIIHIVNSGVASYFEIAGAVKKIGKFGGTLTPVLQKDIESAGLPRGPLEALVSTRIRLRPWQNALRDYMSSLDLTACKQRPAEPDFSKYKIGKRPHSLE